DDDRRLAVGGRLLRVLLEERHFGTAGRAPRRPEVQDDDLPAQCVETQRLAVEQRQRHIGRRLAGEPGGRVGRVVTGSSLLRPVDAAERDDEQRAEQQRRKAAEATVADAAMLGFGIGERRGFDRLHDQGNPSMAAFTLACSASSPPSTTATTLLPCTMKGGPVAGAGVAPASGRGIALAGSAPAASCRAWAGSGKMKT